MADQEPPTNYDPPDDRLQFTLTLLILALLLSICIGLPVWLALSLHAGWGALTAIAACIAWMYLGPPPMPGLLNGIISCSECSPSLGSLSVALVAPYTCG